MQYKTVITVGSRLIEVSGTFETLAQLVEQMSLLEMLPAAGPENQDDLTFCYRTCSDGSEYYSIVCKSSGKEFKFGQRRDDKSLYPKGWAPVWRGNRDEPEPEPIRSNRPQGREYVQQGRDDLRF